MFGKNLWIWFLEFIKYLTYFPSNENFGLTSQVRRSAISISSNLLICNILKRKNFRLYMKILEK
ncbi:MAG: hypothetical protein COC22_02035 [Flavobacteriaceae bacterium]|nr:MAG: hypothetical protein COC22_02035 [Flavobacteriaceae bacterium]